jgi:hypothetical protein
MKKVVHTIFNLGRHCKIEYEFPTSTYTFNPSAYLIQIQANTLSLREYYNFRDIISLSDNIKI